MGLFKQKLSVYGNRVPPRSLKVVRLWIFPALQFHTSLLIARDTCNPHVLGTLWALSSLAGHGHEASKVTGECYITKWRVHTGRQLCLLLLKPQAPKTSGTIPALFYKTILIWQCHLQFVFSDINGEQVKMQDMVESSSGNTETLGCKCMTPSTDYHFAPGSILRMTHK